MEDFWKSVQTIQAERGADYRAFPLFGAVHWAELLVAIAIVVLCAMIYRRCREMTRQQILRAVFVLMLADEFMKQAVLLYTGQWNVTYGALGIMTGTPDAGSLSAEMLEKGQMLFLRYPVHLDARQCRELAEKNQFGRVIPYHSPEIDCPCFFLL